MTRVEKFNHKTQITGLNNPAKQVSKDNWNLDAHDQTGVDGYDEPSETVLSSGVASPANTPGLIVIGAETGTTDILDTLTDTDYALNDVVLLKATVGDTITVSNGGGNITIKSGTTKILSENTPMKVRFDGTNFIEQIADNVVLTDKANSYTDVLQTFKDNKFKINSPDDADGVIFVNSDQTDDRNLIIPILAADDTFATLGMANVFTANQKLNDNIKALFGTGSDASIYYDDTDLIINPKEVGSGAVRTLAEKSWISGGSPLQYFEETPEATDEKIWRYGMVNSDFIFGTREDDDSGGEFAFIMSRSGATVTNIKFFADVEMDGALNHDGSTVGFYATTPIIQQTGVAVTDVAIHAALVALGLITA